MTVVATPVVNIINSTAVLTCTISLNTEIGPDTSFISHYWYQYNYNDIRYRTTQWMIVGDSISLIITALIIDNVQPTDAGVYECGASIVSNYTVISNTANLCIKG